MKVFDSWNLEVHIARVNVLVLELLVEVADGERVAKWVTYESVFFHIDGGDGWWVMKNGELRPSCYIRHADELFLSEVERAYSESETSEGGFRETSLLENVNHQFALREGFDSGCEVAVGTLVVRDKSPIEGEHGVAIDTEELLHGESNGSGELSDA